VSAGRAALILEHEHHTTSSLQGPEGSMLSGPFFVFRKGISMSPIRLSRDWWAVIAAAVATVLVKLGVVNGVWW
jgi:hypothetical protein